MSIASYIKVIGRGRDGARSLDREQAHDLMSQVLDGRVTDLEIGAFALAMRVKSETVAELAGFLDAVHERCIAVPISAPTVVLPSYNGSRKVPNLTALLAMLLAQHDVPVLVHGPAHDATRITTAEIFRDLGLTCAEDGDDIEAAWQRREPAFIRTEALCPPLARLLAVRSVVGLRNSGHTVAKLLGGCGSSPTLRVVNYTHPDYGTLLASFLAATGADAVLMRGTEGEPVADARRQQRLDVYLSGMLRPELSVPAQEGVLTQPAVLPAGSDAATTASTIQAIVSGAMPAPLPLATQTSCLLRSLAVIAAGSPRASEAVVAAQ
jgi:anthranilate phosphoribosyltransferase